VTDSEVEEATRVAPLESVGILLLCTESIDPTGPVRAGLRRLLPRYDRWLIGYRGPGFGRVLLRSDADPDLDGIEVAD
jgi:hypothetical protein